MNMKKYTTFLLILATPVFSEKPYTLEKLTEIALQKSELIQAKHFEWESFDGAIKQSEAWQNPGFSGDAGSRSLGEDTGYGFNLTFSQPFYFPGKQHLRGEVQRTFKEDAKLNLEETKRFVFRQVIFLAFAYKEASHHAEHLEERYHRFKVIHQYLRSRPFASAQKMMEKAIVENRILLLEKEILEVKNEKKTIWEQLNLYLGLNQPVEVQAPWFNQGIELNRESLYADLNKNPEFAGLEINLTRSNLQKTLSEKESLPDFSLSAIYSEDKTVFTERYIGGGISFFLPLWNRNQGAISQYEKEISGLKAMQTFLRKKIKAELDTLLIDYANKRELINKYPVSLIEEMHKQTEYADQEFRKGRIEMMTYLEFDQSASEIHTAIFKSQLEYLDIYLKILAITGSMNFQEEK